MFKQYIPVTSFKDSSVVIHMR